MSIPALMKTLNAENQALNGKTINEEVEGLVGSVAGPVKGLLSHTETNNYNGTTPAVDAPQDAE